MPWAIHMATLAQSILAALLVLPAALAAAPPTPLWLPPSSTRMAWTSIMQGTTYAGYCGRPASFPECYEVATFTELAWTGGVDAESALAAPFSYGECRHTCENLGNDYFEFGNNNRAFNFADMEAAVADMRNAYAAFFDAAAQQAGADLPPHQQVSFDMSLANDAQGLLAAFRNSKAK